jgi:hypothetical protein
VALLVSRYYVVGTTSPSELRTFVFFLALVVFSSIGMSVYYNSSQAGKWPG